MHIHTFDHDHGHDHHHHHDHTVAGTASEHVHLSEVHLVQDASHSEHHDETISELDISPAGLLKKVSNSILALALLAAVFAFILPGLYRQTFRHFRDNPYVLPRRYALHPPLRAPPQH